MTKNLYLCDKETMYTYEINFDENVLKEQINNLCKKIGIDKNILYKLYLQAMVWIKNL